ncbi:hypothetical protein IFM89_004484 [Coptis chinensis]|uniref:Uncharacterized protein n=1 Tax=Coptis chinensis TaxID=261450 RepID=A0A835GXE7_9MAGN|nr:hypothetical protein IFM89_004484 [Coptis chinensis]
MIATTRIITGETSNCVLVDNEEVTYACAEPFLWILGLVKIMIEATTVRKKLEGKIAITGGLSKATLLFFAYSASSARKCYGGQCERRIYGARDKETADEICYSVAWYTTIVVHS